MSMRRSGLGQAGTQIAAGVSTHVDGEGTSACLAYGDRPQTPERLKKWRRSRDEPGQRTVHPGLRDDPKPDPNQAFGVSSKSGIGAAAVMGSSNQSDVQRIIAKNNERMYKGAGNELGKPLTRYELPGQVTQKGFTFGVKGEADAESTLAKGIIYPQNNEVISEEAMKNYEKSHGLYAPGDQKTRNYDWGGIQAKEHRFGKVERSKHDGGAAGCLSESISNPYAADTNIVSKSTFDFSRTKPGLGKAKPLRAGNAPTDRPFGVPSSVAKMGPDAPSAASCIRGGYSMEEQMPDADLGRAARPGFRNVNRDNRRFGRPSVRTDIPKPARRSVADNNNWGDDATAHALLYPPRFNTLGVDDSEFVKQRDPQEIREIFAAIGSKFSDDEFGRIWWQAANGCDWNGDGIVSVEEFRSAMNDFLDCRDEGRIPGWWDRAGAGAAAQLASDTADARRSK